MKKAITKSRMVEYPEQKLEWLVPISAAAAFFRVTEQTIRGWIHDGKLKAFKAPPDVDDLSKVDITKSRKPLYTTREHMAEWAEILYDL